MGLSHKEEVFFMYKKSRALYRDRQSRLTAMNQTTLRL